MVKTKTNITFQFYYFFFHWNTIHRPKNCAFVSLITRRHNQQKALQRQRERGQGRDEVKEIERMCDNKNSSY